MSKAEIKKGNRKKKDDSLAGVLSSAKIVQPYPPKAKKEISIREYLVLTGLLSVAVKHTEALEEIQAQVLKVTGENHPEPNNSNCADWVWGGARRLDGLLERLGIEVVGRDETHMIF